MFVYPHTHRCWGGCHCHGHCASCCPYNHCYHGPVVRPVVVQPIHRPVIDSTRVRDVRTINALAGK